MRAPAFWWQANPAFLASLLAPLGALWGAVAAWRMGRPGQAFSVPVICVGNFVAGGAGKTPLALAIGEFLLGRGERPVFLSRGYGGKHSQAAVLVDPQKHGARDVGDEPLLLARCAPTIVCADRKAGARAAIAAGASVIIMDDGLQNAALAKQLTFAVVDTAIGIGNGLCIPAGPLRAPLAAQWRHVDAVVLIGAAEAATALASQARVLGKPVLAAMLEPDCAAAARFAGRKVLAFAGIGRPEKFFTSLREIGAEIVEQRGFPDHHAYSPGELDALTRDAKARGAVLATTEKDAARLPASFNVETLPVRLVFPGENALAAIIAKAVSAKP